MLLEGEALPASWLLRGRQRTRGHQEGEAAPQSRLLAQRERWPCRSQLLSWASLPAAGASLGGWWSQREEIQKAQAASCPPGPDRDSPGRLSHRCGGVSHQHPCWAPLTFCSWKSRIQRPELRKATRWLTGVSHAALEGALLGAAAFAFHCVAPRLASPAGPGLFSDPLPCACLLPELRQGRPANLQLLHSPQSSVPVGARGIELGVCSGRQLVGNGVERREGGSARG